MSAHKLSVISSLCLASLITAGCADSDRLDSVMTASGSDDSISRGADSSLNPSDEKFDVMAGHTRYATCNDGALIIDHVGAEYVATVTDAGVVDYFISQSESVFQTTVEYSGESKLVSIQRELPWMVAIEDSADGAGGSKQLIIRDLSLDKETESLTTSGAPGNTISPINEGLKLVINGSSMTSSHTVSYYEVGHWFFERCELEAREITPVSSEVGELVADCNEGALTLERSAKHEGQLIATVVDEGVVDYFVEQSEGVHCEEVSYSGETRTACMQKRFPHSVTTAEDGSLVIDGLQAHGDDFATSGRSGAHLKREGRGLHLTVSGSEMTSSHTISDYELGHWFFETCRWY